MAEVRFEVFTNAAAVASDYERSVERIVSSAGRLEQAQRRADRALQLVSGGGAAGSARIDQIQRETTAAQRQREVERQLEADRLRADRQQTQADVRRLRSLDAEERALQRRINAGLRSLSHLGGEHRAYAQLTRDSISRAQALGQEINRTEILAGVNQQLRASQHLVSGAFSTASINAKDLRLNMQGLNQTLLGLSAIAPRVVAPLLNISQATAHLAYAQGAFSPVAGGAGPGAAAQAGAAGAGGGLLARLATPTVIGGAVVAAGTVISIKELIETANELEVAFDEVSAITGIVGEDLDRLLQQAIRTSTGNTVSATEIANAYKLIASASPDLLENADALSEVAQQSILLSQAAGDDLATSVNTVTSALSQFGYGADQASRVVDVLAAGAKVGAVEVPQLGEALSRTGAIARGAGLEIEDLVALIETAGKSRQPLDIISTSLRNILLRLQVSGRLGAGDNIADVLREIAAEGLTADESLKLFGTRAITTAQFLLQNLDVFDKYREGVDETGVASEQARIRLDNLSGAATRASNAFGGLFNTLSQKSLITEAKDQLTDFVNDITISASIAQAELAGTFESQSDILARIVDTEELERRLKIARESIETFGESSRNVFAQVFLDRPSERFNQEDIRILEDAIEKAERLDEARENAKRVRAIGFLVPTPEGFSDEVIREAKSNLRALRSELDENVKAQQDFEDAQDRINEILLIAKRSQDDFNFSEAEAARLIELAREKAFGQTDAFKAQEKAAKDAAKSNRELAEAVGRIRVEYEKTVEAENKRIEDIEKENARLAEQISATAQGAEALAAFNAETRVQEELARRRKEVGFISDQDVEHIRAAVEENERLNATLRQTEEQAKRTSGQIAEIFKNAFENLQRAVGDIFTDMYRNAGDGAEAFIDRLKDLGARLAGELTELALFRGLSSAGVFHSGIFETLFGGTPSFAGVSSYTGLSTSLSLDEVVQALHIREDVQSGAQKGTEAGAFSGLRSALSSLQGFFGGGTQTGGFNLSGLFGGTGGGLLGGILGAVGLGFAGAGITSALGGDLSQTIGAGIGAAIGGILVSSETGTAIVTSIGASVGLGTGLGSFAGPIGAAIGAVAGAAAVPIANSLLAVYRPALSGQNPFYGYSLGQARTTGALAGYGTVAALSGSTPLALSSVTAPVFGGGLGAAAGAGLGATYGAYGSIPTLGISALLGAAIGALVGSLLRSRPHRVGTGISTTAEDLGLAETVETPYGFVGVPSPHPSLRRRVLGLPALIKSLDEFTAQFLKPEEIQQVSGVLQQNLGLTSIFDRPRNIQSDIQAVINNRLHEIVRSLEGETAAAQFFPLGGQQGFTYGLRVPPEVAAGQFQKFIEERATFRGNIRVLSGEEIPQLEQAIGQLNQQFNEASEQARKFGFDVQQLVDARSQGLQKLVDDFLADTGNAILAFTDPLGAQLVEQGKQAEQRLANARIAEANGAADAILQVEKLNALERAKLIEDYTKQANAPLKSLLDELRTGDLGGRSLAARLSESEAQFEAARTAAFATPGDPQLRADFAQAASLLADLKRQQFGSSEQFVQARTFIEQSLEALLATPLTTTPLEVSMPEGAATAALQEETNYYLTGIDRSLRDLVDENAGLRRELSELNRRLSRLEAAA